MAAKTIPQRSEIADQYKWKLTDLYPSDQVWEQDFEELKQMMPSLKDYQGRLTTAENLLACLKLQDQVRIKFDRLAGYAMMSKDQDNTNPVYQGFWDRIVGIGAELGSNLAYIEPDILALPAATVREWVEQTPGLKTYGHYLDNILRMKPHTLPTEQEELLARASEMAQATSQIFRMFNNADLRFPTIKDENGNEVELTHGRYLRFMESRDRDVRKSAFKALYSTYEQWKNTLAATYASAVKRALFFARARKYESSLEAALDLDNVQPDVYHSLIKAVHEGLPAFYRYMELRKKMLGLDELHMYDINVPLVQDLDIKIRPEQAVEMVKTGLAPLGGEYVTDLSKGLSAGWIDWFENKGKTSGAYSASVYRVHPYVLLNYENTVDDMFTLAHEMGHAMHSYYSDLNQEFINADYAIFVAEVASTVNECLVMNDLLAKADDPKQKLYLLNHYLEQFRGTVFRQTMFAEFEMIVHDRIGSGVPMTAESLCQAYHELNQIYYGPEVISDPHIAMEWARIPHFYRPFYVYKYATGFSAAVTIAQKILNENGAVTRYLEFLRNGGSDYPLNLLKKTGVDLTTPEPIMKAIDVFGSLVDQMERLASELKALM
ncbi:MAG: oligoendopeptidase F [Firmicutes bacterium]|nr:oligoendopeptidase F [Bacillota bacterium]